MNTPNPTTNPTAPLGPAKTAAPDGLVVGKKYKYCGSKGGIHDVWWYDGRKVLMGRSDGAVCTSVLTPDGFSVCIARGELVPADDEAQDPERFDEATGPMPEQPAMPEPWTWWKAAGYTDSRPRYFFINADGKLRFTGAVLTDAVPKEETVEQLDAHRGPRQPPSTCPARPMPLSDPASNAISAHTTPGKGEPTSIDIEAAIAEQAMRRLAARLEAEFGCRDANFTISSTGRILLSCPDKRVHEFGNTIADAIAAVRAKLTATRCTCPACGRGGA